MHMLMYMYLVLTALAVCSTPIARSSRQCYLLPILDTTLYRGEADRTLEALLKALLFLVPVVAKHF